MLPHSSPASRSDSEALWLASYLKAAADPLRLMVLRLLKQDSFAVLELCHLLAAKQSGMSHHLKILAQAGLVATRREGNTIFYRRATSAESAIEQAELQQALFARIDQMPLDTDVASRLAEVQHERIASSRSFFEENAALFREQQEQIADYDLYGPAVAHLLDQLDLPAQKLALEIGPGNGQFLDELARRFGHVIGLDNNQPMLAQAAEHVHQRKLKHVQLRCGEIDSLPADLNPDCVVLNMVLHHTPSPAEILAAVGQLLPANAVLLICELSHHQQSWVRESCGDIWLGFDPNELTGWLAQANLSCEHSQYLALRNGFQIQIHAARKLPSFSNLV
ncbi:MAG TPA: metalloregulator ArsR/SmtB family transcription factor [Pseudomonadales bacterium]|nr:metalloregulator ArsR/SmtB family transcription factor [Pseudomonadales bacterium]